MAATVIRIRARDESRRAFDSARNNAKILGTALQALGPAIVPIAASAAVAVASVGSALAGAAVAGGVFALAVKGQTEGIKNASTAYDAYNAAVKESGKDSKEAKDALAAYKDQMNQMPAATQATAKEFIGLKSDFKAWSDSLAGSTMPVFTKGLSVLRTILPMLTPLVKATAAVFDDLMTKLKTKVESKGFESFMKKLSDWAVNGLKKTIDGIGKLASAFKGFVVGPTFQNFIALTQSQGPGIVTMFKQLAEFVGKFISAAGPMAGLSLKALEILASTLNAIPLDVMQVLVPFIMAVVLAIRLWTIANVAWTAAQWLLNAAMAANPITLWLIAIAAVIAIIVLIYNRTTWLQTGWKVAWNAIKTATSAVVGWLKGFISKAFDFIKMIFLNFTGPGLIIKHWNTIKSATSSVFNWVRSFISGKVEQVKSILRGISAIVSVVVGYFGKIKDGVSSKVSALISFVKGIPGKIKAGLGNLGNLLVSAGKNIIQGLIKGVTGMIGSLKSKFSSITNMIPDWKGPMTVDAKLLTPNGKAIMGGFMKGVDRSLPALRKQLGGITASIPATVGAGVTGRSGATSAAGTVSTASGMDRPLVINMIVDGKTIASASVDGLRKLVKNNGGNVQTYLGA